LFGEKMDEKGEQIPGVRVALPGHFWFFNVD
jgi:hypothetical protein